MARPRTLGPTITFRLPIDLHTLAAARAAAKGMTVNEYLADRLTEALSRQRDVPTTITATISTTADPAARQVTPVWKASMKT